MKKNNYTNFYNNYSLDQGEDIYLNKLDLYRMNLFSKIIKSKTKGRKKDLKILDVGSRNAWLKKKLDIDNVKQIKYSSVDISENSVNLMKNKGIDAHLFDISNKTDFKNNNFDIIILGEILEHLPNIENALNECRRILKTNGVIIGSVPNVWNFGNVFNLIFKKETDAAEQHIYFFDRYHLRNLFKMLNFKIVKIWVNPFSYTSCNLKKIDEFFSRITNTGAKIFFIIKKKN